MKFCKNLQRVVDISDPEWAPYWTNYKMLKKLIKELPSLVPSEATNNKSAVDPSPSGTAETASESPVAAGESSTVSDACNAASSDLQHRGDETAEAKRQSASASHQDSDEASTAAGQQQGAPGSRSDVVTIGKSPGEIAFFKLLHAEFKKATHFFDRAQQEYIIREERVREGMEIMKQPNSIMVGEKWSLLAKSIYRLYKDLLLLETFAIMTYCGFSKILKKHDKVTGYSTRNAFMANIVNNANFTNYPKVLEMISRCEQLYEEVSNRLELEGKQGLYEDERLFINMIHRLNEQVIENAEEEGAPERKEPRRQPAGGIPSGSASKCPPSNNESWATSSLRNLVNDIDANRAAGQVSECTGADSDDDTALKEKRPKRPQVDSKLPAAVVAKRPKPDV